MDNEPDITDLRIAYEGILTLISGLSQVEDIIWDGQKDLDRHVREWPQSAKVLLRIDGQFVGYWPGCGCRELSFDQAVQFSARLLGEAIEACFGSVAMQAYLKGWSVLRLKKYLLLT